jgi:hypothetical protein
VTARGLSQRTEVDRDRAVVCGEIPRRLSRSCRMNHSIAINLSALDLDAQRARVQKGKKP